MSLKVWLPLNGDLENKGTSNVNITANGATVNTSGKIGSCYSFDGSDDYISLDSPVFYDIIKGGTQPFSIAMWIYHNDSTRAILFGDYSLSGAINFNIELTTAHQVRFYWNGSPDKNFDSNSSVGAQTWTHIALTYDGSQLLLYKNGAVISDKYSGALAVKTKSSGAYYLGRDSRTGSTALNGRLNDFRLYDHCLSALEVKEISQALILHYKLDNINTPIQDSSGYNNNGTFVGSIVAVTSDIPRYSQAVSMNNTSTTNHIESINDITLSDNISVSFWVKASKSTSQVIFSTKNIQFGILNSLGYVLPSSAAGYQLTDFVTNSWNHICVVKNAGTFTLYVNGNKPARSGSNNYYVHNVDKLWLFNRSYNSSYGANASISDFRFYATPLLDNDVIQLYNIGMKIDNLSNTHAFEFDEEDKDVLAGIPWTIYNNHSLTNNIFTNYNSNGEPQFTTNSSGASSNYIEITPGTYYYDMTISVNSGNQFYVGFERYDANKTARENGACTYIYTTKPTSNVVKQRYKGTVNLSTDGVNTLKYITLRVLNGWSGTTSGVTGQATIHHLSLRPVTGAHSPKLKKTGQLDLSELKEYSKSSFYQNRLVEAAEFIER